MQLDYDYKASSLKRIELSSDARIEQSGHKPQTGDVIAVRITEQRGEYGELDLPGGDLVDLEEGDVVLGCFGNRAGVKGYIGTVPERIEEGDDVFFLGSGGIFGAYKSATKELGLPYRAEFIGYVSDGENILNMKDFGVQSHEDLEEEPVIVAVVASRMDAGKTTIASELIEGLTDDGYAVGSVKLTGSARERDRVQMYESGSQVSLDFVDGGMPSTVDDADQVIDTAKGIVDAAWMETDLDVIVAEFGAGIISNYNVKETLQDLDIRDRVASVVVVSLDVAGAYGVKKVLSEIDYDLDLVSGPITDTTAGVEKIEDTVGVPALNAFRDDDVEQAVSIVAEKIDSFED